MYPISNSGDDDHKKLWTDGRQFVHYPAIVFKKVMRCMAKWRMRRFRTLCDPWGIYLALTGTPKSR